MKDSLRGKLLVASSISLGLGVANVLTAILLFNMESIYFGWLGIANLFIGTLIWWVIYQDDKE